MKRIIILLAIFIFSLSLTIVNNDDGPERRCKRWIIERLNEARNTFEDMPIFRRLNERKVTKSTKTSKSMKSSSSSKKTSSSLKKTTKSGNNKKTTTSSKKTSSSKKSSSKSYKKSTSKKISN